MTSPYDNAKQLSTRVGVLEALFNQMFKRAPLDIVVDLTADGTLGAALGQANTEIVVTLVAGGEMSAVAEANLAIVVGLTAAGGAGGHVSPLDITVGLTADGIVAPIDGGSSATTFWEVDLDGGSASVTGTLVIDGGTA